MDVRYNGRTLRATLQCAHPPVTANREEFTAFAKRMQHAARGAGMRMAVVLGGGGKASGIALDIVVNTDETSEVLEARMRKAVERERIALTLLTIEEMEPVGAALFWTKLRGVAAETVAKEKNRS